MDKADLGGWDHRDILLEATSSQKVSENGLCSGEPTLSPVLPSLKWNWDFWNTL